MPPNGWSSSRIRKIAPETDSAQMTSDAKVVALAGAMREKPANKIIIQSSNTAKNGMGIELPRCEKRRNHCSFAMKGSCRCNQLHGQRLTRGVSRDSAFGTPSF